MIYLSMRATSIEQNLKFAVTECSIVTPDETVIRLFAPGAETSPTCSLNAIGLVAHYDGENFNFQHILFNLKRQKQSSYRLECTAEVCEKNDPDSFCNKAVLPCIGQGTESENDDSENNDSENTDSENNNSENTDSENTDSENKDSENNSNSTEINRLKRAYFCNGFCNGECTVENDVPICTCFLGDGLEFDTKTSCTTCSDSLHSAVQTGNSDCVRYRISQGDEVDEIVNGTSSLYQAVRNSYFEVLQILVENDASVEQKSETDCQKCTRSGDTPLHQAVLSHENEMVSFLLENGANVTTENSENNYRQAIHEAVINFNFEAIDLLVDEGANINSKDGDGNTERL